MKAHSSNRQRVFLHAGHNHVALDGDGDDLGLRVYDSSANPVSRGNSYTDGKSASVNAERSGYFYVEVVNRGQVNKNYELIVR